MTRRGLVIIGSILVTFGAVALFQLKYTIEAKERLIAELNRQYVEDERAIRVLKAEWSYLNSPDTLQESAARHLEVEPLTADRILGDISLIPLRDGAPARPHPVFSDPGFMPRANPVRPPSATATEASLVGAGRAPARSGE